MIEKLRKFVFNAFIVGSLSVGLIVAAELIARAMFPHEQSELDADGQPSDFTWDQINVGSGLARARSEAYRDFPWAEDFVREKERDPYLGGQIYDPFGLWTLPSKARTGKYRSFTDEGYHHTPVAEKPSYKDQFTIFLFGSSTIAGDGIIRDQDTIPAFLCRNLNAAIMETQFRCFNYGHSGYNSVNELLTLVKLLREGKKPDLLIFYDNDTLYRVLFDIPHMRAHIFSAIISNKYRTEPYRRVRHRLMQMALDGSRLLQLLTGKSWIIPPFTAVPKPELLNDPEQLRENADQMIDQYLRTYNLVADMAGGFGYRYLFLWQPDMFSA